ncbi:unnamed protein product [Brassicogethes aeneus]|uniref:Nucleoporin Ndc1 n=1 Tax=Brassicogethes aeneus TaxID=1431903 RepID=A0A9P0B2L3_BRAAE|nr:unnamed protein product [Brassicogethes aeneus]
MNSNADVFIAKPAFTYKDLLLRKLYYSVLCSVFSQLVLLLVYLLITKFDLFHPITWIKSTLVTFVSLTTWLYLVPLIVIIFAQSVICAKDYAFKSTYCSTRFQKLIAVFSIHNFVLLILHVVVGGLLVWMFLSLSGGPYQSITTTCNKNGACVVEGKFLLILNGLFIGLYFFLKVYLTEKRIFFPVIHQGKLRQFKASMFPLIKECLVSAVAPSLYFMLFYFIWGSQLLNGFKKFFNLQPPQTNEGNSVYLYAWLFGALYYFSMNLMRFFFNLFLTEPVEFPLVKQNDDSLTLQASINMNNFPIIQSLACLDLKILSQWFPERRQVFFTLSQPGGHPHNWNGLVENILKLYAEYTELLNKSTDTIQPEKSAPQSSMMSPASCLSPMQSNRYRNFRNMSMTYGNDLVDIVDISHQNLPGVNLPETIFHVIQEKIINFFNLLKVVLGINFMFGELPQANIQKCLANGHLIIQTSEGLSELICRSIIEDRFGIVQKDLPVVITSLVELKQSLERLNKIPALTRKMVGYDDFNYKMKGAVTAAVKRSLFNICKHFEKYLHEFPLSKEVVLQLQPFVAKN